MTRTEYDNLMADLYGWWRNGTLRRALGGPSLATGEAASGVLAPHASLHHYDGSDLLAGQFIAGLLTTSSPTFAGLVSPSLAGGIAANDDLTLQGTTHATRATSYVLLQPNGGNVGIGTATPVGKVSIAGSSDIKQVIVIANAVQSNTNPLMEFQQSDGTALLGFHSDHPLNIFLGNAAGAANLAGSPGNQGKYNLFIGSSAGTVNTTGQTNIALGAYSLLANTTGSANVGIGALSLYTNQSGGSNTALGSYALFANIIGSYNTGIGNSALYNCTGGSNVGIGVQALYNQTTPGGTIGIGVYALYSNVTGAGNVAIGYQAGFGAAANSPSRNTIIGYQAGYGLSTGSDNLLLGYQVGDVLTTGVGNIVIGYNIDLPAIDSANMLDIGNLIYAVGLTSTGTTVSSGSVGIATTDLDGTPPIGRLVVKGSTADGSTNILVGRDSAEVNVVSIDTDGYVTTPRVILNSTANLDGATAGIVAVTGVVKLGTRGAISVATANILNLAFNAYEDSSWHRLTGGAAPALVQMNVGAIVAYIGTDADPPVWTEQLRITTAGLTMANAKNIVVGTTTGSQIGTAAAQKVGFHGATPVVQAAHIADATDLATALTRIAAILVVLENKGFTALA